MKNSDLQSLVGYAKTPLQREYIQAFIDYGSYQAAADALGVTKKAIKSAVHRIKKYYRDNPTEQTYKGATSTLYGADGDVKLQWVKRDALTMEELRNEIYQAMLEEIPRVKPAAPTHKGASYEDSAFLINQYLITDYHLGMLSWPEETGEDWNIEIAEKLLVDWFKYAIAKSPPAQHCVFVQLGDFLHYDSMEAVTPTAKNLLDSDTRYANIVRAAVRVVRTVIEMLRTKYQETYVIMAEGNHDMASSVWLREMLAAMYEEVSGVTVNTSVSPYYVCPFGQVTLFYHHGHKCKIERLPEVLAGEFPMEYGLASYRYAHVGHLHYDKVIESALMRVEQHRTLAARDAYASRSGYKSQREAKVITYDRRYGEIARLCITPEMVYEAL